MKLQWEQLCSRFDALNKRERLLIAVGMVMVLLSVFDTFLLQPVLLKQKGLHTDLAQQQQVLDSVKSQVDMLMLESAPNSKSPRRMQLEQLQREMAAGNAFLQNSRERLVEPQKMAQHLRNILNRNNRLQLVALQTLPVSPLLDKAANEPAAGKIQAADASAMGTGQVYKHGVQLTLRGSYLDLMNYLSMLESLPQQMFWSSAKMKVQQYPVTELTVVVYTLSLDKTWLQI